MGYQEDFDLSKSIAFIERVQMAVLDVAAEVQGRVLTAPPSTQQVRESLLAFDAIQDPRRVANRFAVYGAVGQGQDPPDDNNGTHLDDTQVRAFILSEWDEVAGKVDDGRVDSTSTPIG